MFAFATGRDKKTNKLCYLSWYVSEHLEPKAYHESIKNWEQQGLEVHKFKEWHQCEAQHSIFQNDIDFVDYYRNNYTPEPEDDSIPDFYPDNTL